jgi:mannose-6-phosphate isomerase-like protein (cupin superfamily)
MRNGQLPQPASERRPSGVDVGIFDLVGAPFTLANVLVPRSGATATDSHPERELWIIKHGHGTLTLDGHSSRMAEGDVFYFDSDQVHGATNDGDEPLEIVSLWWDT